MFSENGKISGRQAFRLLTFDLLGYGTLVIPSALAEIAGRDGIFCIGIGVGAALFFLKLMACAVQETAGCSLEGNVGETNVNHAAGVMCGSYAEYLEHMFGQFCGKLVQTGYLIYFLLLAGYTAYLFCAIVIQNLLRDESYYLVLFVILILAWYGQGSGLEGRARVYELLFPLVLLPLFFMLASAVDEVETDYWMPVFGEKISGIPAGSYAVFIACSVMIVALFAGEHMRRKQSLFPAARAALLFRIDLCGPLSDSARYFWRGRTGTDEISCRDADEYGENFGRFSEKGGCVYVWNLVFYLICTAWERGILWGNPAAPSVFYTRKQNICSI